jgi:MSHA biogenesis protein MshM
MYRHHFGLSAAPFSITPDTAFAFSSRTQQEALDTLLLAIDEGEGFIKVTGEVGTGKTLLCRRLLALLGSPREGRRACETVYLPNPCLSPRDLLRDIGAELRLGLRANAGEHAWLARLNEALLGCAARDVRVVVCLDETQAMPPETLETLRLLSNLETEKRKLLQVALFGQPELDVRLARHDLRQLASRISFHTTLTGLSRDETGRYLEHRLGVAGHTGAAIFAPPVAQLVHRASRGVPRLVNVVCDKALLAGYIAETFIIGTPMIQRAIEDTECKVFAEAAAG